MSLIAFLKVVKNELVSLFSQIEPQVFRVLYGYFSLIFKVLFKLDKSFSI